MSRRMVEPQTDVQMMQGLQRSFDRLRGEFRGDLREFKEDILRELRGTDGQVADLAKRVTQIEIDQEKQTKRWPTSAVVVTTSLIVACAGLIGAIATLIH